MVKSPFELLELPEIMKSPFWVIKIDTNSNLKWQKTIGGSEIDFAYDAVELNDKSIIVVGDSGSSNLDVLENKGFTDVLICKIK